MATRLIASPTMNRGATAPSLRNNPYRPIYWKFRQCGRDPVYRVRSIARIPHETAPGQAPGHAPLHITPCPYASGP
ncbi:MAG TPA: hypothetical protein VFA10_05240, partial [Ktedonobacteraceae bacterium]|nr:hypothetical protein [Ktedonobacteraceae bacterium]